MADVAITERSYIVSKQLNDKKKKMMEISFTFPLETGTPVIFPDRGLLHSRSKFNLTSASKFSSNAGDGTHLKFAEPNRPISTPLFVSDVELTETLQSKPLYMVN